ncbi:porin family protein [Flavobacterium album]|uniref:Porin family protein n=1 Tax=Flavobacterium album TaxID=2175091 RepID=A0A2S1QTD6_9FLAO|nr:outer membrane beta-barrel protein [Flavobacterium album]AWH83662.1 porin family protein [Flavobacterium album]
MKKLLFTVAALAAFGFAQAQDEAATSGFAKGDVFVSGSLGLSSEKTGDVKSTDFNVTPRVGYFVSENIAIGAQLGFRSGKDTDADGAETKTTGFEAGAFARYYGTPGRAFSFFGQLNAGYNTTKTEFPAGGEAKTNGFGIGLAPGISYFVSDHIAFETTFGALSYNTSKPDADGAESTDTFNLNLNLSSVTFGMIYKF